MNAPGGQGAGAGVERRRRTDLASGLVLMLLAGLGLFWLVPSQTAPAQSPLDLPPGLMPSLALAVCLALAILLVARALRPVRGEPGRHEEFGAEASGIGRRELFNLAGWIALSTATMLALPRLGFLFTGALLLAAVLIYARARPLWLVALLVPLVPLALQQVALHAFTTELP